MLALIRNYHSILLRLLRYYHRLVFDGLFLRYGDRFLKPPFLLIAGHVLMIQIIFLFLRILRYFWFCFLLFLGCCVVLQILLILGLNNFMELFLEFGSQLLDVFDECLGKNSWNLMKLLLPVLEPKYRHAIVTVPAIQANLPIFVASLLNIPQRIVDVRPNASLLRLFILAQLTASHRLLYIRQELLCLYHQYNYET